MHTQSNSTHFCVTVCTQISSRKCLSKRGIKSEDAKPLLRLLFRPSSCKRGLRKHEHRESTSIYYYLFKFLVKMQTSCASGPTVQTDPAFSVAENTFFKPGPRKRPICVFVIGFVWTPNMQTMTSLPPPPHQEGNLEARRICFVWFHLYYFIALNTAPW